MSWPMRVYLLISIQSLIFGEYTPKIDPKTFEVWRLKIEKKVKTTERAHRLQFSYRGQTVSPWHDIPFYAGYFGKEKQPLLHFVCEIPRMTHAKLEIHKGREPNPLIQDTVANKLRFYKYGESIVNYGAITQTWEDPNVQDPDTGVGGDNDPIDVLQLNSKPCRRGAVQRVRVLGALALVDGGETDWKLLVVDVDDGAATGATTWGNLGDIPEGFLGEIRQWFKMYKTAEGKFENAFALTGKAVGADHAFRVAQRTHQHWRDLVNGNSKCVTTCDGRDCHCWIGADDRAEL